jgi:hypothetical protein
MHTGIVTYDYILIGILLAMGLIAIAVTLVRRKQTRARTKSHRNRAAAAKAELRRDIGLAEAMAGMPRQMVKQYAAKLLELDKSAAEYVALYDSHVADWDPIDPNRRLSTQAWHDRSMCFASFAQGLETAQIERLKLKATIEHDKQQISPEGREERLAEIMSCLSSYQRTLDSCARVFPVASDQKVLDEFRSEVESVIAKEANAVDHDKVYHLHCEISELEDILERIDGIFGMLQQSKQRLNNAATTLFMVTGEVRHRIQASEGPGKYQAQERVTLKVDAIRSFCEHQLTPDVPLDVQAQRLAAFAASIRRIADDVELQNRQWVTNHGLPLAAIAA